MFSNKENRKFALNFSYKLENRLDPHIDNFMIEKDTGKIVIIDTEHFPSMVGLKEVTHFKSYAQWYMKLAAKGVRDSFFRHKKLRRDHQFSKTTALPL